MHTVMVWKDKENAFVKQCATKQSCTFHLFYNTKSMRSIRMLSIVAHSMTSTDVINENAIAV